MTTDGEVDRFVLARRDQERAPDRRIRTLMVSEVDIRLVDSRRSRDERVTWSAVRRAGMKMECRFLPCLPSFLGFLGLGTQKKSGFRDFLSCDRAT